MEETLRAQVDSYLAHLDGLIRRGQELRRSLETDLSDATNNCATKNGAANAAATIAATRRWQEECGMTIHQLSGGSKAHWLARAFSEAFLVRSADGRAAQGASPAQIVQQLLDVLAQAVTSLSRSNDKAIVSASTEQPAVHRFDFVHNAEIRPVLERAYADGRNAFEKGDYDLALMTSCGILESIVTDALEHKGLAALIENGAPTAKISDWSFETRLAVAEKTELIRGGAARLPAIARTYRERMNTQGEDIPRGTISEDEANKTGQVLRVIMRDLDPGR